MLRLFAFNFLISLLVVSSAEVLLLDFSGDLNSTSCKHWKLTNDPVMGGVSYSTWTTSFTNGSSIGKGVWDGKVFKLFCIFKS